MKFGLLSSRTLNLGDEIQAIAARQFLPGVDVLVDRERPNDPALEPCRIILNGWHTHRPDNWPPAPALDPLIVSFHVTNELNPQNPTRMPPAGILTRGEPAAYLKRHQPIGARDLWTLKLLQDAGIESYFSACLTLTLGDGAPRPRGDHVCAVDAPQPVVELLRSRFGRKLVERTHMAPRGDFEMRTAQASQLLGLYASARCVVTTRLHCALPCLAFGTPVLLLTAARDPYRFTGLLDLLHHCSAAEFLPGGHGFDVEKPPPNSTAFQPYRARLIRTVTAFVQGAPQDRAPSPFSPDQVSPA